MNDKTNPSYYKQQPFECIQFTKHMNFALGNAFKYVWRYKDKNGREDLMKALWYLNIELKEDDGKQYNITGAFKMLDDCNFDMPQYQALRHILLAYENDKIYGERKSCIRHVIEIIGKILERTPK